jgi:hypothetical protein
MGIGHRDPPLPVGIPSSLAGIRCWGGGNGAAVKRVGEERGAVQGESEDGYLLCTCGGLRRAFWIWMESNGLTGFFTGLIINHFLSS